MVEEAPRADLKTEISQSDIETLTHEDLLEITQSSLRRLTASDPLLQDLPVDVTLEEVLSQIAVLQGQSITVTIDRYSEPALSVVVRCFIGEICICVNKGLIFIDTATGGDCFGSQEGITKMLHTDTTKAA